MPLIKPLVIVLSLMATKQNSVVVVVMKDDIKAKVGKSGLKLLELAEILHVLRPLLIDASTCPNAL